MTESQRVYIKEFLNENLTELEQKYELKNLEKEYNLFDDSTLTRYYKSDILRLNLKILLTKHDKLYIYLFNQNKTGYSIYDWVYDTEPLYISSTSTKGIENDEMLLVLIYNELFKRYPNMKRIKE